MTSTTSNPADAVREALLPCPRCKEDGNQHMVCRVLDYRVLLCRCDVCGWSATAAEQEWLGRMESAATVWNRIAALAGAAPVAWYVELVAPGFKDDGMKFGPFWRKCEADNLAGPHGDNAECVVRELFPHAPAKARVVTEADVERAAKALHANGADNLSSDVAWEELHEAERSQFTSWATAALATFAEGA